MEIPEGTYFVTTHEYTREESPGVYVIGVSDKLINKVGYITNIVLPEAGDFYDKKEIFAIVESDCAAAEIHMTLRANILQVNPLLHDNPSLLNTDPYGEGWIIKVKALNYEEDSFDFENFPDYVCNNQ